MLAVAVIIIAVVALLAIVASVRILKQYERGVQFRLGKVKDGARGPGLIFIAPLVDRVHRVSLRIVTMPIQSQGIITKDNVSVDVSAVAYFRIKDAVRSVVAIENVDEAISQIAQTTLRAVVGRTPWTRRCLRPRTSTATSAPSSMSRPRTGVSR
jgi:regulator of protease activity HflC (stomatin/prohibitin superfamily)